MQSFCKQAISVLGYGYVVENDSIEMSDDLGADKQVVTVSYRVYRFMPL
jgi:hypothetical protein